MATPVGRKLKGKNLRVNLKRRINETGTEMEESDVLPEYRPQASKRLRSQDKNEDERRKDERDFSNRKSTHIPISSPSSVGSRSYSLRSHTGTYVASDGTVLHKSLLTPYRTRLPLGYERLIQSSVLKTPKIVTKVSDHHLKKTKTNRVHREQWKSEINDILNRTWKTCYLSSMCNFKYLSKSFKKKYEKLLKARICDVYAAVDVKVDLQTTCFIRQDPNFVDGLVFRVNIVQPIGEEGEVETKRLFDAWLFKTDVAQSKPMSGVEWFPFMIYAGPETVHNAFSQWLRASFGCYITPKGFPQSTLMWVAGVWSRVNCNYPQHSTGLSDDKSRMTLNYVVKPFPGISNTVKSGKTMIQLTYNRADVLKVFYEVSPEIDGHLNKDLVYCFDEMMSGLVHRVTSLPQNLVCLTRLTTTCVQIVGDGRIKMLCPTKFVSLLKHLIELFLVGCHASNEDEEHLDDMDSGSED